MKTMGKPVGLTKDSGWQFGLRKTFPYAQKFLWDLIFSEKGLKIWLGVLEDELELKKPFKTKEGIEGYIRVFKPYSHIRMDWKKKSWKDFTIVQVRIMGNQEKSTLSFHQEKLLNSDQREEMKVYWNKIMDEIEALIRTEKN